MSKKQNLTFEKNNQTEKHLQPYCAQVAIAAVEKQKADELREQASKELQDKLESDPETRDFTGTVVYICEGEMYKIRVQRPDKTDWLSKRLSDPQFKEYKALMLELGKKELRRKELETDLAAAHPKCVEKGFVIGLLSKR